MNRFWGFVKKEFLHIFRDWRTLIILLGMPIIQILIFGFAITNEIRDANIAILDNSKDEVTHRIINKIASSGYFRIYDNLKNNNEIEEAFQSGKVKMVALFEEDFAERLQKNGNATVDLISDASDPNTGNTLLFYFSSIIQSYQMEINQTRTIPLAISAEIKMFYNPELKGVFLSVPGLVAVILMLISAMMTSISITREKELGSMEVLLVSPAKPWQIIIAKVIPYLALSFVISLIILAMGRFVFGIPMKGNLVLLLGECVLFNITALSLGVFISTRTSSQQIALTISLIGLMMPTIMLSGYIYPVENMPLVIKIIANLIPAKWFITIMKDIMLKGAGLEVVWRDTLVLCGFTALFILLSIKNFKVRLK